MDGSIRFGARWNADGGGLLIGWWDCIAVGTVDSGFAVWDVLEYRATPDYRLFEGSCLRFSQYVVGYAAGKLLNMRPRKLKPIGIKCMKCMK
ncbi:hypothetical protein ASPFODRAFT_125691 [Aspergillus luchuensis CBS 106.47]|uniref:Uncharacterized protein n=1 Tax=Aspergillus luchuensis (strain CBS 106.47) TaxID=1137211 RepID=A0A1M3TUL6_ASPLC|nr:hypothetical protein ASPFODRAFT_125691 [Aspergillus luchuensis CBS 106.47]